MILWRVAAETRQYPADDLSGNGAAAHPGRWNEQKQPVVYTAPTIALAVLETAAHVDAGGLPLNRFLVRIDAPDDMWGAREERDVADLPQSWMAIPAGKASVKIGSDWLKSMQSPILLVPSVIVPEEPVALVNPLHPDVSKLTASIVRPFEYDRLFRLNR